jgi:hypothetical protein
MTNMYKKLNIVLALVVMQSYESETACFSNSYDVELAPETNVGVGNEMTSSADGKAEMALSDETVANTTRLEASTTQLAAIATQPEAEIPLDDYEKEKLWQEAMTELCRAQGLSDEDTKLELERQQAMLYENCLPGSNNDYSETFKETWNTGEARGFMVSEGIENGTNPILLPKEKWTKINEEYYGCKADTLVID